MTQCYNMLGDKFPFILVFWSKFLAWLLTTKYLRPYNEQIWAKNQNVDYKVVRSYGDLLTYFTRDPNGFDPKWDTKYEESKAFLSPVQGTVVAVGHVNKDRTANVLNGKFNLDVMLKEENAAIGNVDFLALYPFCVIFLSPTDIHNVYFPFKSGVLLDLQYIAGKYLLTNPYAIQYSSKVYEKNFRVSFKFKLHDSGQIVWLCMVSANLVGVIESQLKIGDTVAFGQKVGNFLLGSTVVIVSENRRMKWKIQKGDIVNIMDQLN